MEQRSTPWRLDVISAADLARYATIPMTIKVEAMLMPVLLHDGLGGLRLDEEPVARPYEKDYDCLDGGPLSWPVRFDLSTWHIIVAVASEELLGGAAAFGPAFGFRDTIAELFDIRVQSHAQRSGVGRALLAHQKQWAYRQGFLWLKAETQNVNVGACRFYQQMGGTLGSINRFAYAGQDGLTNEAELDWFFPCT
jgi:GNAT superfamily N-acetyltransferase